MGWTDGCTECGAGPGNWAFVDFEPDLNDAQAETEWGEDLVPLKGIVCMECGYLYGVFDPREVGVSEKDDASEYRIDEELR